MVAQVLVDHVGADTSAQRPVVTVDEAIGKRSPGVVWHSAIMRRDRGARRTAPSCWSGGC